MAEPSAGAVGCGASGGDPEPHCSLATSFDERAGAFHEDGELTVQELRLVPGNAGKTIASALDLLAVVEEPGDVVAGGGQFDGQLQGDGDPTLHVAGAPPVDPVLAIDDLALAGKVPCHGDGVQMSRDEDPAVPTQVGLGDDAVPVADHVQM